MGNPGIDEKGFRPGVTDFKAEEAEWVGSAQCVGPQPEDTSLRAVCFRPPLVAAASAATDHLSWVVAGQPRTVGKLKPVQG